MTTLIPFDQYALIFLKRQFPPMASRRELLNFMGGNSEANLIWTNYIIWHCGLNPAKRNKTFRAWLNKLERADCTNLEWSLVADIKRDKDFPRGCFDRMTEYLAKQGAPDSTLDSLESLWIKYNFKT